LGLGSVPDFRLLRIDPQQISPKGGFFLQGRIESPVFLGDEFADFLFPLAEEADGHGLHPPGAQPPAHLVPEKRTHHVSHQPVQDAARLLGFKFVLIQRLRLEHGLPDAAGGDFVAEDPMDAPRPTDFLGDVPGDGFSSSGSVAMYTSLAFWAAFL
jgi:hypothetical protein